MKTFFISIYDGDTEKNILRTGVHEHLLAGDNKVVLLIRGKDRLDYYRKEFGTDRVLVELLPPAGTMAEKIWYFIAWNIIPTHAVRVRQKRAFRSSRSMWRYIIGGILWLLGHLRMVREALRWGYGIVPDNYADELFEKYGPATVFSPGMFSPEDCRLLRAARRKGMRTVTMGKSWDVLTTKAFTRVKADTILVFNEFNRYEAITIGDYPPEHVVVTGFPQFDMYADKTIYLSRAAFCEKMGFDPEKRIILFAVPGDWKSPYSKDILEQLDDAIDAGRFSKPTQILARLHPKYGDSSEMGHYKHIHFDRPGSHFQTNTEFGIDAGVRTYQWKFGTSDIEHLANSLYHSDVVINTDSTLTLDATAVDRPAVLIGYDGNQQLPYQDSIAYIYEREHYKNVVATGGAPLARSLDELIRNINSFLSDPDYLCREREELKRSLLYMTDGKAAERVADAIRRSAQ